MGNRFWIETLGCPKNEVDSAKLGGSLEAGGLAAAESPETADLVVVNTCAFIEAARQESVEAVLAIDGVRRPGSRLVVTGCMAERYQDELARALPEVDLVAPFGIDLLAHPDSRATTGPPSPPIGDTAPVWLGRTRRRTDTRGPEGAARPSNGVRDFDLLNLPRRPAAAPWAYVKIAEGCDRHCGFCAIPSFRGRQRSRSPLAILDEVEALSSGATDLKEVVLVAQDLASFGLDRWPSHRPTPHPGRGTRPRQPHRPRPIVDLVRSVAERVAWVRLLYLFPSRLDDELVEAVLSTGVPYFDLSLQHVSRPLLAAMRRPGDGERFLDRIRSIRGAEPGATFRSSFIVGYPGEREEDHDRLLDWLGDAQLDWVGFFPYSLEEGTHAADLDGQVAPELVAERIRECSELQDAITAARRDRLIGERVKVLVTAPGEGRTYREAPQIDGIVKVPDDLPLGAFADLVVTGAAGPDLEAERPAGSDPVVTAPSGGGPTVASWTGPSEVRW
jgi:ribosomal protein S12 methylthiotransferase